MYYNDIAVRLMGRLVRWNPRSRLGAVLLAMCVGYLIFEATAAALQIVASLGPWISERLSQTEPSHAITICAAVPLVIALFLLNFLGMWAVSYVRLELLPEMDTKPGQYITGLALYLLFLAVIFGTLVLAAAKLSTFFFLRYGDDSVPETSLKAYRFFCGWPMLLLKTLAMWFILYLRMYPLLRQQYRAR
ncbi:MAG: hypothetical protein JXL80_00505 [Planctomycetes bacterium]|nr:hypothetical protein [Planctomycetota bacterium]